MKSYKYHVNDDNTCNLGSGFDGLVEDKGRRGKKWRDDASREIFWKLLEWSEWENV